MANQIDTLLNMPGPGEAEPIALPEPEPHAAPASQIDPTVPVFGQPTTASVRANFATAQTEITGLMQATQGGPWLALAGGKMGGPMYLYNDPTDVMMPVTLGYFNANGGGGTGGGGIPEAPADHHFYTRSDGAWVPGVALAGGTLCQMTGELLLAGNPADPLGAVPKQYADAIAATANGAVPLAGTATTGPMTGLLVLSGDPTNVLGAVTKQYADTALALKANAANPTFTGIVTVSNAGRIIVQGPSGPSLTLYNTTSGAPCFGVWNTGQYLGFGLATPSTGNPNGSPFATMDQSGNFLFATRVNVTGGRLISSLSGAPSLTLNNTSQGNIFGFWNDGTLAFGLLDANGTPTSNLGHMTSAGTITCNGAYFNGDVGCNTILTVQSTANLNGPVISRDGISLNGGNYSLFMYDANGSGWNWGISSSGAILYFSTSSLYAAQKFDGETGNIIILGTGYKPGGGAWSDSSDARIKTVEGTYDQGLAAIMQLQPKRYVYRGNHTTEPPQERDAAPYKESPHFTVATAQTSFIGLVADDVAPVFPECVTETAGYIDGEPVVDLKQLDTSTLTYALINAVKELGTRLAALEGKAA